MECRRWGAHLPHVAGIAGQSDYGAQSVALSGGYEYDEDHGEWFLYTGSSRRDLSGNKKTNKSQSIDQKFEKLNEALWVSCQKGYPVQVVRSHKGKLSSYARNRSMSIPFVRCDNSPAPWTRKEKLCWMWKKPALHGRRQVDSAYSGDGKRRCKIPSIQERLLKEFSCVICRKVRSLPLTTPCAHNFCKGCLESAFAGQTFIKERTCEGDQTLRARKNFMKCPSCSNDIFDFLQNPQVNRELMGVIESLQHQSKETEDNESSEETDCTCEKFDVVSGDAELCNVNSDVLEEDEGKKGNQNSPSKIQPQQIYKRKKARGGDCIYEKSL